MKAFVSLDGRSNLVAPFDEEAMIDDSSTLAMNGVSSVWGASFSHLTDIELCWAEGAMVQFSLWKIVWWCEHLLYVTQSQDEWLLVLKTLRVLNL